MGNLPVVEEEPTHMTGKFLPSNSETMGHRDLANRLGVFLTNARVKILKAIKQRQWSEGWFFCLNHLGRKARRINVFF